MDFKRLDFVFEPRLFGDLDIVPSGVRFLLVLVRARLRRCDYLGVNVLLDLGGFAALDLFELGNPTLGVV